MMTADRPAILVVDDDVDTCANLKDILQELDYEVDTACDGEAALALFLKKPYDLALLDLKMPGMDGLTLYRELRRLRAETVAMIVTAFASSDTAEQARAAGAWQVLSKPVDFAQLAPLVEQAVHQPLVLIVDDDPDLCSNLWDMLREYGYRVCVTHNRKDARRRLQERGYRVVLIDIKLPDGNGHELIEVVRQTNPESCTVLITGYRTELEQVVHQSLQEGADAVCYKPFDVSQVLATIQRLVKRTDE